MVHSAVACSPEEFLEVLQYPNQLCTELNVSRRKRPGLPRHDLLPQSIAMIRVVSQQEIIEGKKSDQGRKTKRNEVCNSESEAATTSWRHARAVPSPKKLSSHTQSELLSIVFFLKSIQATETKTRQWSKERRRWERSIWISGYPLLASRGSRPGGTADSTLTESGAQCCTSSSPPIIYLGITGLPDRYCNKACRFENYGSDDATDWTRGHLFAHLTALRLSAPRADTFFSETFRWALSDNLEHDCAESSLGLYVGITALPDRYNKLSWIIPVRLQDDATDWTREHWPRSRVNDAFAHRPRQGGDGRLDAHKKAGRNPPRFLHYLRASFAAVRSELKLSASIRPNRFRRRFATSHAPSLKLRR
ncbi:hypothetical protein DFH09DRAFT_1106184 [Mycena vulgaris]|nr:hypothetical protein DFH09DRAFT_1106184 [Mycena vulgaris]